MIYSDYFPSGQTSSKLKARFPENYPEFIEKGKGAYIYDDNGNEYIDLCCSLGAISLGYRYNRVDEAVISSIRDNGTIFSLPHKKEMILAEILESILPFAQQFKYFHNGKDATAAAIRLARYHTGRELVASFSYHGADDQFMACTKADKGVIQELKKYITDFDYNDFERVKEIIKFKPAAIIVEPHTIREPKNEFVHWLRSKCDANNIILIFDEVVSCPRYPGFSASKWLGVEPDLICLSKGIANGYPISVLAGKKEIMKDLRDGEVFASTTFGGNLVGVSAAIATLSAFIEKDIPAKLCKLGKRFKEGIKNVKIDGSMDCRLFMGCSDLDRQKVWQESIKEGIFFHVPIFFNASMTEKDIDKAINVVNDIDLKKVELKGRKTSEVFRKK